MALAKEKAYERLRGARKAGRLAHACLLCGPPGSGKAWLVRELAALVLETAPERVESHPDFHQIAPESKLRRILIDPVRALERLLHVKALCGESKVAVIQDADRLQPEAANAFLKTLEEPPAGCLIILTTTLRDAVLPTILSRCITIPLLAPDGVARDETSALVAKEFESALLAKDGGEAAAFGFTRFFQARLAEIRESVSQGLESELKEQLKRHRDSVNKAWQEECEDRIKAQTESTALRERERLLAVLGGTLAAALRHRLVPGGGISEGVRRLAESEDARSLLRRLDALERTRRMLASGVQEALALESGFLQIISNP
jgi:DNA polymerase-3 subunit delta'